MMETDDRTFAPEAGHPDIQHKLLSAFRQGRLPHAFLFHGPEGCGKDAFAIALAQLLNAADADGRIDASSSQYEKIAHLQHPDVKLVFPTPAKTNFKEAEFMEVLREKARNPYRRTAFPNKNTFIGIDTIRELKAEARFTLYEGRRKVFIISEAEQMRVEAANALLKLLEEPPGNLVLILVTANIYQILPTIKSRCQLLRFTPLPEAQMHDILRRYHPKVDPGELSLLIRLSGYNLKRAFDFLDKNVLQIREQAIDLLRKVVLIHRSQELMAILEPVAARQNREDAQLLLWLLLLWFQDILHLKQLEDASAKLYNPDKKDTLRKFMGFTPNADITGIVWDIEGALQDLRDVRNFNPLLILMTLAIKLHQKLKKNKK